MYLPFFRGKQFELIAQRELSWLIAEDDFVISPIIEPVKSSFTTFRLTLESFVEYEVNFNLILNPIVGELKGNQKKIVKFLESNIGDYSDFQIAFYINNASSIDDSYKKAELLKFDFNGFAFIHTAPVNNFIQIKKFDDINETIFNIIHFGNTSRRYHRNFNQDTVVSLDDCFKIHPRNVDYTNTPDEPFSEEHLYYKDDGFVGYSDYLMIGENYLETGFLPYAVVIHLTYTDENERIRIRHFVSDSNDDTSDVGGKFAEALEKLIKWIEENDVLETRAIQEFKTLYENKHFPGLGYIKKLSIKHHIELVHSLLSK